MTIASSAWTAAAVLSDRCRRLIASLGACDMDGPEPLLERLDRACVAWPAGSTTTCGARAQAAERRSSDGRRAEGARSAHGVARALCHLIESTRVPARIRQTAVEPRAVRLGFCPRLRIAVPPPVPAPRKWSWIPLAHATHARSRRSSSGSGPSMSHAPSDAISRRHRSLRTAAAVHALDAMVITALPNILYLTNFGGSSAIVVVTADRVAFITDSGTSPLSSRRVTRRTHVRTSNWSRLMGRTTRRSRRSWRRSGETGRLRGRPPHRRPVQLAHDDAQQRAGRARAGAK